MPPTKTKSECHRPTRLFVMRFWSAMLTRLAMLLRSQARGNSSALDNNLEAKVTHPSPRQAVGDFGIAVRVQPPLIRGLKSLILILASVT